MTTPTVTLPLIGTPRLRLRAPAPDDAPAIFDGYAQDREVTRYLSWRTHTSLTDAHAFLRHCATALAGGTEVSWVIEETERLAGMISLRLGGGRAELGYVLARAHWGRGLATEAARAVVAWGLARADCFRVWAVCDVENHASTRVLEKTGMMREDRLQRWIVMPNLGDEPRDVWCYARVR